MKRLSSPRLLALVLAIGGAALLIATAEAMGLSSSHARATGNVVALRTTSLGSILVDARGRTLYLFEKDRNGVSMCDTACAAYWPPLTGHRVPRAVNGVHQSLLRLGPARHGMRQVTYAGHPLYTFVGDKRAGQTTGEGLRNFGAEWYAVAASGHKVEKSTGGSSSGGGYTYGSGGGGY